LANQFAGDGADTSFARSDEYSSRTAAQQVCDLRQQRKHHEILPVLMTREKLRICKSNAQVVLGWCIMLFELANRASEITGALYPHRRDSILWKVGFSKEGGIA